MGVLVGLVFATLLLAPQAAPTAPAPSPSPAARAAPKAEILGIWKGTSTCTKVEGNEFCRDEKVVYNFVDVPDEPATVVCRAGRVVDDFVEPMYELFFTYRPDLSAWASEFERPRFRGVWSYIVHGDELTGTATVLPTNKIVRNVSATRDPKDAAKR